MPKQSFWRDAWVAWSKYNSQQVVTKADILNQILWYNSNITCRGKVFDHMWLGSEAIKYISDICDETTNKFYTYQELQNITPVTANFIAYFTLIANIPEAWKIKLSNNN